MIASVTGATNIQQWNKYASQKSMAIALTAGETYFIEALHKQGVGSDNIAVGWQLPNGTLERPIPGNRLSPFQYDESTNALEPTTVNTFEQEDGLSQINVYPNPFYSGDLQLKISGFEGIGQPIETNMEMVNITGEVIYAEKIICGGDCDDYQVNILNKLIPGVYVVNFITNGRTYSKRLLVK